MFNSRQTCYEIKKRISEHTFSNLFVWRHSRPIHFTRIIGTIVFLISISTGKKQKFFLFGPPIGNLAISDIVSAFQGDLAGAIRLPRSHAGSIAGTGIPIRTDRDNDDYVYSVKDLGTLAGRNYAKKRNQIIKCLQRYHCEYEPISKVLIPVISSRIRTRNDLEFIGEGMGLD